MHVLKQSGEEPERAAGPGAAVHPLQHRPNTVLQQGAMEEDERGCGPCTPTTAEGAQGRR